MTDAAATGPVRHYATAFDHRYLVKGLAMADSLERHGGEHVLHVLALSPECAEALRLLDRPRLDVVELSELEAFDPELAAVRPTRTLVEYYFTLTPAWMRFVLARRGEIDLVTWLDADLLFFSSPEPLFAELGDGSIAIVPHRFPERLRDLERYGRFNVSWVSIRSDDDGSSCLGWWRERCLDWCFDREEEGRFADQKYLDEWPARFGGVRVIEHPGADVAPWNLDVHEVESGGPSVLVDGRPLVFFHAHGFDADPDLGWTAVIEAYGSRSTAPIEEGILAPYVWAFEEAAERIRSTLPDRLRSAANPSSLRMPAEEALRRRLRNVEEDRVAKAASLEILRRDLERCEADRAERLVVIERLDRLRVDLEDRLAGAERDRALLEAMRTSASWRWTAPFRWVAARLGRSRREVGS